MTRKIFISVVLVLLIVAGLTAIKAMQFKKMIAAGKAYVTPPESVSSAVVKGEQWQGALHAIGSITAVQGVMVTSDLPGTVREIAFESGAVVEKGALLVRQDTSTEDAQFRAIGAQVDLAKLNLERVRTLRSQNMVSQADLDTAEATLKQNQANADAIRATIDKKTIRAPFAGRLGIRQVDLGQYLDAGKSIVSLQALAPIYVDFSLPQQELARLEKDMRVRLTSDAYPGREFEGNLTAINPDLDSVTRSVRLQATLSNSDQMLRPGMYVRVQVLLPEKSDVLVIPATAVLSAPYGDSVYVIEPNPTNHAALMVRQQLIRSGQTRGDFLAVESGLKEGQKIASAGVFKLRNGMAVVENNEIVPPASENPRPPDS